MRSGAQEGRRHDHFNDLFPRPRSKLLSAEELVMRFGWTPLAQS